MQDLLAWSLVSTDLDESQQAGAIVLELSGEARNLVRNLSMQELQNGGMVNGQPVGPVSYILSHLALRFAPLGEETRMNAVTELMQFHRNANENIDALLVRYMSLRYKAQQGGGGQMSWEMYSWLLLRACGVNQNQLLNILQPLQGRFPNNEQEFNGMELTLRRMGHILENAPMNLASQLRSPPTTRHYLASFGERYEGQPRGAKKTPAATSRRTTASS